MRPLFGPSQGRIVKAVVLYLSKGSNKPRFASIVVESIATLPWASLTFAGERHCLVVRLPGATFPAAAIRADELNVPGAIVAIERADWATAGDSAVLTLDLLAIATTALDELPTR